MDEAGPLTVRRKRRSAPVFATWLLVFPLLFHACTSSEPKLNTPPAPSVNFSATVKSVTERRGLAPTRDIILAPNNADRAGSTAMSAAGETLDGAPIAQVEHVYKDIGLLSRATDLTKALAELRQRERLISYNRADGSVSWSATAARMGAPLSKLDPEKAREFAPVLAIVNALQEQHFDWRATIDKVSGEDRRAALRAVAAGDAVLTLLAGRGKHDAAQLWPSLIYASDHLAAELDKLTIALPDFLRRRLTFPYRSGGEFVYRAFRLRGWAGVNTLYAAPPRSTAEILHPRSYYLERESPLRFFPPHLLRRFKDGAVVEHTLGEDTIAGLLASEWPAKFTGDPAPAWRGDQIFAFRNGASLTTVWFSAWRTDDHAEAFLRAYRAMLESRQRARFDGPAAQRSAPAIARKPDQTGLLLQRFESTVLLVSASQTSHLTEIAKEAWRDLEIENERSEIRFESARLPGQFSLRSK